MAPLEKNEKRSLIRNIRALVIWKISGMLVNSTDNIIITYFNGLITVGLASNYTLLSETLSSFLGLFFGSLTASIGNLNAIESKQKRMTMFNNINFANFWLFGWAAIGVFAVSSDLVGLFFGKDYVLPRLIPFVIALNFYMVGIQNAVWSFQNAMGLFRQGRYLQFLTAGFNLAFSILLGKIWGLFGILIATAISRLLTNTWFDPYKVFHFGFQESVIPYYLTRLRYLAILVLTGGLCCFVSGLVDGSFLFNSIYRFLVCSIIPNSVFYLLFRNTPEFQYFRNLVVSLWGRVFNKA